MHVHSIRVGWVCWNTRHMKHSELSMRAQAYTHGTRSHTHTHTKRERKSKDNWEWKIISYNEGRGILRVDWKEWSLVSLMFLGGGVPGANIA